MNEEKTKLEDFLICVVCENYHYHREHEQSICQIDECAKVIFQKDCKPLSETSNNFIPVWCPLYGKYIK